MNSKIAGLTEVYVQGLSKKKKMKRGQSNIASKSKLLAAANKTLTTFHRHRREDVESGKRPTVRQSLERLSSSRKN